jgi:glutamyl-tRNA reductase
MILMVGLSHQNTPVDVRERVAFTTPGALERALGLLKNAIDGEFVLLSTCNRTELYVVGEASGATLVEAILTAHGNASEARGYFTEKRGHRAVEHLFRVTAGLESMVLGENDIVRQVKEAYAAANGVGATRQTLNPLFHEALRVAKRARTEMELSRGAFSVGHAAAELAATIFGDLKGRTVLLLGAGKMSETTARHLTASGATSVLVANRTYDRAVRLAEQLNGRAISYESFAEHLQKTDIVIASTAAPGTVVSRLQVAEAMRLRRNRPLFLIDIAVPRDIEPSAGDVDNVFLYNVDDLTAVVEGESAERRVRAARAEALIHEEAMTCAVRLRATQSAAPLVTALRAKHHAVVDAELLRLRRQMPHLGAEDWEQIERAFTAVENKIAHAPTQKIHEYAQTDAPEKLEMVRELFGVEPHARGEGEEK